MAENRVLSGVGTTGLTGVLSCGCCGGGVRMAEKLLVSGVGLTGVRSAKLLRSGSILRNGLFKDGVGGGLTGVLAVLLLLAVGLTGVLCSGRTGLRSEKGVAPTTVSGPLGSVMYCVTLTPPLVM